MKIGDFAILKITSEKIMIIKKLPASNAYDYLVRLSNLETVEVFKYELVNYRK